MTLIDLLKMNKFSPRIWFSLASLSCIFMLSIGAYFQFVKDLEPCPLCISQRIFILAAGIVFALAAVHNPSSLGRKIYAIIGVIVCLLGASVSTRHIWLQNLPPESVPECGPGLEYVFEHFPLSETVKLMLNGTGECADVLWTFLGLSIPGWTLVAFLLLAATSLLQFYNHKLS